MLSTKYLVLIAVLVAAALGLGHDLKTLLSKYNANCDVNQLTCKSSFGVQCCTDPLGVCCEDGLSCCPQDFSCDEKTNTCKSKYGETKRRPTSFPQSGLSKNHLESTNSSCTTKQCNGGETCCHDDWGCCPVPNAVCCSDDVHCCPYGYTCQTGTSQCTRGLSAIPWLNKESAIVKAEQIESVQCDATHYCPSGNTCCRLSSGQWGCCPVPNAVCCSDDVHCCPYGYTCQTGTSQCTRGLSAIPWLNKESAIVKAEQIEFVQCDATHDCPSGNTCCRLSSGQWGCCPVPNAVCCSDDVHCCPYGYTCQTRTGQCTRGFDVISWMNKIPASKVSASSSVRSSAPASVSCDDQYECPDEYTCCHMLDGGWGCCPYMQAVCCEDGMHCCPNGYTCDSTRNRCIDGRGARRSLELLLVATNL
ncbi:GRN [Bugula neritina]|uniref:GRN n=1 Tax=Bugula neritina TaxID=10212 RepID=A0A7J7KMM8_BUGNE|nr:GRN [Bugula neritina]